MVTEDERFEFLALRLQVYPLYQYAVQNLTPCRISLAELGKAYSFEAVESKNTICLWSINPKHAANLTVADCKQPILLVKLGEKSGNMMIDGLHRAYRLWKKGQKTIRAYHITDRAIIEKHSNINEFKLD